jgi:hypothetical protein
MIELSECFYLSFEHLLPDTIFEGFDIDNFDGDNLTGFLIDAFKH